MIELDLHIPFRKHPWERIFHGIHGFYIYSLIHVVHVTQGLELCQQIPLGYEHFQHLREDEVSLKVYSWVCKTFEGYARKQGKWRQLQFKVTHPKLVQLLYVENILIKQKYSHTPLLHKSKHSQHLRWELVNHSIWFNQKIKHPTSIHCVSASLFRFRKEEPNSIHLYSDIVI